MQLDVLREYVTLCKHLNFSHAARELHMSQPLLSKHIAALERELGFSLIERGGTPRLTPTGDCFLIHAQQVITTFDEGVLACRKIIKEDRAPRLLWFDRPRYEDFLASLHDVPYTVVQYDGTSSLFDVLETGQVDVIASEDYRQVPELMDQFSRKNLASAQLGTERLSIAVANTSLLASKRQLCRADLHHCKLLLNTSVASEQWRLSLDSFLGKNLNLRYIMSPSAYEGINQYRINLEDMVYIYTEQVIHRYLANRDDVVIFDELDGNPIEMPLVATWCSDNPNPHVHAFVDRLRAWYASEKS